MCKTWQQDMGTFSRSFFSVLIKYGNTPKAMVIDLLEHSKIEKEINPDMLIGIKQNLVVVRPSTEGATTSPELVAGVIEYLQSKGLHRIIIMEGSWVGDRTSKAFEVCGYNELSKKYNVRRWQSCSDE